MLTKFLTEDDDQLKENGGIFDQSGFDGLDSSEDIYPQSTEMRNKQRARSAVNLFTKQTQPDSKYEAYGCIDPDDDDHLKQLNVHVHNWLHYTVLLMAPLGIYIISIIIKNIYILYYLILKYLLKYLHLTRFNLNPQIQLKINNYFNYNFK